ncbi:glycosyltransferase [Thiohalobacter sp. IOR34]|uniref:glycosyltransferase n=1 Tax=Thiohalobacter sp. IOR34 TaxID=3057176 RepID=UPI0025B1EA82|nr:glycosyltransferase [Thiohalobacter sp. IOR34]WJW75269.1 glycosyltransferase [Thiohalobacter sp. IOR34]
MTDSLHILGSRGGGGAENFFLRLVGALNEAGHRAAAVVPADSQVAARLPAGVPLYPVPMRSVWDLPSRWAIRRLVRRLRPAIVQTYMGRATRLTRLPAGGGTVHLARLGGYYDLKGYRHAHAWIGNTRGIRDYLIAGGLPAERVFHIGNFIDPPRPVDADELAAWRARLGIPPQARLILGLGRLHPNKGFADLLDAFERLPAEIEGRPLHLLIAGDGPLAGELHAHAGRLGCGPRIHWAGWIDDPSPCFRLAELFVCPSRHEPLGNVILEAWAEGLPVLTTASQGARELVTPGENGLLAGIGDIPGLAAGMQRLLEDAPLAQRLAEAGLSEVRTRHSREAVVGAYLDLYRRLAG